MANQRPATKRKREADRYGPRSDWPEPGSELAFYIRAAEILAENQPPSWWHGPLEVPTWATDRDRLYAKYWRPQLERYGDAAVQAFEQHLREVVSPAGSTAVQIDRGSFGYQFLLAAYRDVMEHGDPFRNTAEPQRSSISAKQSVLVGAESLGGTYRKGAALIGTDRSRVRYAVSVLHKRLLPWQVEKCAAIQVGAAFDLHALRVLRAAERRRPEYKHLDGKYLADEIDRQYFLPERVFSAIERGETYSRLVEHFRAIKVEMLKRKLAGLDTGRGISGP